MSDGSEFSWSTKARGKGYTKPKTSKPSYTVDFPFQTIKALLSGDDKKIRSWLEKRAGSVLTEDDLLALLPPGQHDEARTILRRFAKRSPVELSNELKNEARRLRAAATKKENTIDSLVEGIPLPLSDKEVGELEVRKEALGGQVNRRGVMSPEDHEGLRLTIGELAEALEAVDTQIRQLPEAQEGEEETFRIASIGRRLSEEHLTALGPETCFVCMRQGADVQSAYDRWVGVLGDLQAAGSRTRLQRQYDSGLAEVTRLVGQYKAVEVADLAPLMEQHESIVAQLATHGANRRIWKQAEGLRKEVAGSRSAADTCAALSRTWGKEGKQLLVQRKKEFEDKVTQWLPEGEVFVMDLEAGRVGLSHVLDLNTVRTSLSGAELSRVLLAVLSAEGSEGSSTPSILEPEDRGWDPDTLADVMSALTDSPDQVILMSTVPPRGMTFNKEGQLVGDPPGEWSVIRVGS